MNFEKAKAKAEIVANEVGKIIMKIKENNDYWYFHVGFPHTQFFDDDAGSIFVNKKDGTIIESHLWLKEVQKLNWEFYLNSKTIYNYYEEYLKLLIERARKHYRCPSCNNEVSTVQLGEYGGNFVNIVKQEKLKMSYFDDILVDDDFNRDSCFICHKCNKEFDENMDEYINDCLIVETGNIKKRLWKLYSNTK